MKDNVPKIPKKLFKNPIPQQTTMEREFQKELMIKEVQHEIKRLRILSGVKKDFIDRIENEMAYVIDESHNTGEAQQQLHKWREAVEKEANLSRLIWDRRSNFFKSDIHLLPTDGPPKMTRSNFLSNPGTNPLFFKQI